MTGMAARYPNGPVAATPSLEAILRDRLDRDGALNFADFMAAALYHPELGYYGRETRQVGRGGDFFTSVSVGPLFGALLARRFLREWEALERPDRWRIIECGAHDGTLAADILSELGRLSPNALRGLEYAIPEPLPRLRAAQRLTLAAWSENFCSITNVAELPAQPLPGIAFGNELLDALPFHLVERAADSWHECLVANSADGFTWQSTPDLQSPALREALANIGDHFPLGYRAEVRTNFRDFLEPLTRSLSRGLLLWPDYGFARPELYHPDRTRGTLRTFSKHRAADNPLATAGEIDITAHVDFTAVAEAALALGAVPTDFRNQGAWLTEIGREWLLAQEGKPDMAALRQFQTLTHPAHLGGSFHVLELAWNQAARTAPPEVWHRLALGS